MSDKKIRVTQIGKSRELTATPEVLGRVKKIAHLVKVDDVA